MLRSVVSRTSSLVRNAFSPGMDVTRRVFAKIYHFKEEYPELAKHIHPDSMKLFNAEYVDSSAIVKWTCPKGPDHVWESDLASRIRSYKRRGTCGIGVAVLRVVVCACCSGRHISVTNCLATRYPAIAKEWDKERNGALKPEELTCYSTRSVWWTCPKNPDHHYLMPPSERVLNHSMCPFCNQSSVTEATCLEKLNPALAAQWSSDQNGTLTPKDVGVDYAGKVWWVCPANPNHHWRASVRFRVQHGATCPICKKKRNEGGILSELNPALAKEWDFEKNGKLHPEDVSTQSAMAVWWKCKHGVEWKQSVYERQKAFLRGTPVSLALDE